MHNGFHDDRGSDTKNVYSSMKRLRVVIKGWNNGIEKEQDASCHIATFR